MDLTYSFWPGLAIISDPVVYSREQLFVLEGVCCVWYFERFGTIELSRLAGCFAKLYAPS